MKLDPHIQNLAPLSSQFEQLLWDAVHSVNLDDPLALAKEEAFFDACTRYDAETEFFNSQNNFYSGVLPSKDLRVLIDPYIQYLTSELFPGGRLIRAQIGKNLPGGIVNPHIDPRLYHKLSHRVHAVLVTNERVRHVYFDEQTAEASFMRMEAGFIYDFDNITPHAAFNLGTTDRIHIICDVMPTEDYDKYAALLRKSPNYIMPGVFDKYYQHLRAIEERYGGKAGLKQLYEVTVG